MPCSIRDNISIVKQEKVTESLTYMRTTFSKNQKALLLYDTNVYTLHHSRDMNFSSKKGDCSGARFLISLLILKYSLRFAHQFLLIWRANREHRRYLNISNRRKFLIEKTFFARLRDLLLLLSRFSIETKIT